MAKKMMSKNWKLLSPILSLVAISSAPWIDALEVSGGALYILPAESSGPDPWGPASIPARRAAFL
jgi:hypothetical protein